MSLFSYLLIGHLIGDFLFQTTWMAIFKTTKWVPLIVHCVVYTISVTALAFVGYGLLPVGAIVLLFMSHIFLDRRIFVAWWVKHIMNVKGNEEKWLLIMVDQIFHIIILGIIAHSWF
ncbi:DUF3307 domain-containing protein [Paenisporosarcina sp. TG20]|uniref:DUF3307 domain-containing protein n=1 Tax=Paenisporosarcina sp. TG20 TaxID=1211706 RepID=UPI0002EFDE14|nr:DUF3307 domain-containing protein [Paenisporosarcina sp. TG20]